MYFNPTRLDGLESLYGSNSLVQQNLANFNGNYGNFVNPTSVGNSYSIIHGYGEAKNYPVVPNHTCILFDDEKSVFYRKSVDSMGVTDLRVFEYTEKPIETETPAISNKTEIDSLKAEISELKSLLCQNLSKNDDKSKKCEEKEVKDAVNIQ